MAVRPNILVHSHSILQIAGSNSDEIMNIRLVFVVGIGELITRSEETYRVCVCVDMCV
jgi:hypothetical protein